MGKTFNPDKAKEPHGGLGVELPPEWRANMKIIVEDVLKQLSGEHVKSRSWFDAFMLENMTNYRSIQASVQRVINNNISTDHMNTLKASGHWGMEFDRQLNIDEVARLVVQSENFSKGITAIITDILAALTKKDE